VLDLSQRAAELLDTRRLGVARVKVEYLGPADVAGSDDRKLLASLTTNGPARFDGPTGRTLIAQAEPATPPAPIPAAQTTVRMAQTPPAPVRENLPAGAVSLVQTTLPAAAPLPPSRPFDLGTIPGAGVPIAAPRPRQASVEPARASRALNYAPDASLSARLQQTGPFARIVGVRVTPSTGSGRP
jgi:rare lipoprotein A